jgi:transcriptional regulator
MYLPRHFQEDRVDVIAGVIRDHPLATLVSLAEDGLLATHLPMLWDPEPAPLGTLTGHVARPNPHARVTASHVDSLAIFTGPQAYVSPSWYPSKREHGKVVPTWNYMVVHACGPLRTIDDAAWVRTFVTRLTAIHERDQTQPWRIEDAPASFIERVLAGIVGLEMPVRRFEGKWKLSQNRADADVAGTIEGLDRRDDPSATAVADAMRVLHGDRRGA